VSPTVVGWVSDVTGNILWGVLLVPLTIFFGGLTFLLGWRLLPEMETEVKEEKVCLVEDSEEEKINNEEMVLLESEQVVNEEGEEKGTKNETEMDLFT